MVPAGAGAGDVGLRIVVLEVGLLQAVGDAGENLDWTSGGLEGR